jgi:hypothetical protein
VSATSGWNLSEDHVGSLKQIDAALDTFPDQITGYRQIEPVRGQPGSSLASDDLLLHPFPASALIATGLASAADCLDAVQVLIGEGAQPNLWAFAQYPLLRSALEASAQVLWLLGSEDEHERMVRNLRVRATEIGQDATLFALVDDAVAKSLAASTAQTQNAELARIASRNGIDPREYAKQIGYAEIVREGCDAARLDGARASAVWRLISGFSHSYTSRSRSFSTLHSLGSVDDAAGVSALTTDPKIVLLALTTTVGAFTAAVELASSRML